MNRKGKWIILAVLIAGMFAVNPVAYFVRSMTAKPALDVAVRADKGPLGHNTISVDESTLNSSQYIGFSTLKLWDFRDVNTLPPPQIAGLNKKKVSIIGFMYPLQAGDMLSVFCLLKSTQTCCYGPRPQYNQYVLVECKKKVKFERLTPVIAEGQFFVDPSPQDGYIYRMTADSVRPISEDSIDIDANDVVRKLKLPRFNFDQLENLRNDNPIQNGHKLPDSVSACDGKKVVIDGFIVARVNKNPATIIVGKYPWDGVMQGTRPDFYDAAVVIFKNPQDQPPLYKQKGVFTGTLHINRDPNEMPAKGIISLTDAQPAVGASRLRPIISPSLEIFGVVLLLSITFGNDLRKRFSKKGE
jgi:hypothetical protein